MQNADQQKFWTDEAGPTWVAQMAAMDRTLAPVLDAVITQAALLTGERVIDIGCGGGTSTFLAADQVGEAGHVCGLDISRTLLDAAVARAGSSNNVRFELADAQTYGFDGSYDALISRFGVMFFDAPATAFANMTNALGSEGRMVFATWGAIPENPFFTLPAKIATDVIGRAPKSDPDAPGPLSLRDLDHVVALLEQAGLTQIEAHEVPMLLTPDGTAAEVADLLCHIGSAQRVLAHFNASPDDRARLVEALSVALSRFETVDGIRIPALINIFTALKAA